jgi:hypothetical protein
VVVAVVIKGLLLNSNKDDVGVGITGVVADDRILDAADEIFA